MALALPRVVPCLLSITEAASESRAFDFLIFSFGGAFLISAQKEKILKRDSSKSSPCDNIVDRTLETRSLMT
jgi:hypothetical protein